LTVSPHLRLLSKSELKLLEPYSKLEMFLHTNEWQ
jgi:hypothetical protein